VIAAPSASAQITALLTFMSVHETPPDPGAPWRERHQRARAAIRAGLESLREAHGRHDDTPLPMPELAGTVRRWIEGRTFAPRTGANGVLLMDAPAAAYADVDAVRLVGLVETDWPERSQRSIFYPPSLLVQLGWPAEADRLAAARARFRDLLRLPRSNISLSTFTLEDDAIVPPSPLLEEIESSGLPVEPVAPADARIFQHEAIASLPIVPTVLSDEAAAWLALRASRSPAVDPRFHGDVGLPAEAPQEFSGAKVGSSGVGRLETVYAVSRVERYLDCPFKYFAAHVLGLPEERQDQGALTPQERGQFLHEVFEDFFRQWQAGGGGAITTANLAGALELFGQVANTRLAALSESDRALERTYLLGSAVAPGLAERAFGFEIEQGEPVIERLLEHALEGEFEFRSPKGTRRVRLRAKADRIDLLADGGLRVIDYKLGKAPKPSKSLQLAVYGACAEQQLDGRHGRSWKLRLAGYVAFKEKNAFAALGGAPSIEEAAAAGQERFLSAIDAIERGAFPVQPDEPFLCTRCGYAALCRKDYVGDE
jgi:RecB family exonuclease